MTRLRRVAALLPTMLLLTGLGALHSAPAHAAAYETVWVVNGCGQLMHKNSWSSTWAADTPCGLARQVEVSPDGRTIMAVVPDGAMLGKRDGRLWETHIPPGGAKSVALGGDGGIWVVNGCDQLMYKTSWMGAWTNDTPCGGARQVEVSPDGQTIMNILPNGSLIGKHGYRGLWTTHTPPGGAKSVALGGDGGIWVVNGCDQLMYKTSWMGAWANDTPCGGARQVEVSPDGQTIMNILPNGSLIGKHGYRGLWATYVSAGAKSVAVSPPPPPPPPPGAYAVTNIGTCAANYLVRVGTVSLNPSNHIYRRDITSVQRTVTSILWNFIEYSYYIGIKYKSCYGGILQYRYYFCATAGATRTGYWNYLEPNDVWPIPTLTTIHKDWRNQTTVC